MQRAIAFCAAAAVLIFAGAASSAELSTESAQYYGHAYVNVATGNVTWSTGEPAPAAGIDVYSNVLSPANFAVSSTSIPSIWGDRVTTLGTGILAENDMTIYNSSSSAGPLLTAQVSINFYNGGSLAFIGAYGGSINFGAGLPAGFYTIVTFTGLDVFAINLNTNDIIETQQVTAKTGAANRLGIASLDPPTIGLSGPEMYINSVSFGPAGFYTFANGPANPGYRISTLQVVKTESSTWGKVKALYR